MGNTNAHYDETMQKQVLGPINYSYKKCYMISKENYKHFSKSSDKILGQLSGYVVCTILCIKQRDLQIFYKRSATKHLRLTVYATASLWSYELSK
jgi:hypothetical protein